MQQWVSCPVCGKHLMVKKGMAQIQGGTIETWCKLCKHTIEIYGNCKTRLPSEFEKVHS